MVADSGRIGESASGEVDSKRSLWRSVLRLFEGGEPDQSLRALEAFVSFVRLQSRIHN